MGNNVIKKTIIDGSTGEVLKEKSFFSYDGFNDKGYKYRYRADYIRYYWDAVPAGLSEGAFMLLIMLTEICNDENVLVYRIERKSKFSKIIYKPMDKEEIRKRLRYKYGKNKFDKCWQELKKHCVKQIEYYDTKVWAINPAIFSRCKQIPPWLYDEFKEYLMPYMSNLAINKFQQLIKY